MPQPASAPSEPGSARRCQVQTPVFTGPFELLLHLVTQQQVDLYEVSISGIVDDYLTHLDALSHLDLEVTTEFLLIAATLVELKTRRLLPGRDDVEVDEELALWEERDVLLARLLECKTFQEAARSIERLAAGARRSAPRVAGPEERFVSLLPDLLAGVTAEDLRSALVRALTPTPTPRVDVDHVAPVRASVRDAVDELTAALPALGVVGFRRLTAGLGSRLEVIVRFLALLELYKDGVVELDQPGRLAELQVVWLGPPEGPEPAGVGRNGQDRA